MCIACIDPKATDAFAERLVGMLNQGALCLMISVGHRTGLFDAMADLGPADSEGLASHAGLNERYVREWLGAMVTGGLCTLDPKTGEYTLPPAHAASLTRAANPANLAVTAQFIPQLGAVEDGIVESFRSGGGVPYEEFKNFHKIMADESDQSVVSGLEEHVIPLVPGLREALEEGIAVLDVGCGSGRAMNQLARRFPMSRFTGYDLSQEAVTRARSEATTDNVTFAVKDVAAIDDIAQFELVTAFDAIHDQAHPDRVLAAIRRAVKPGGTFLMQDIQGRTAHHDNIGNPLAPLLYTISTMHCMTVSLAQGGMGLGAMWGREKAEEMLREAGFQDIAVRELSHDIMNYWYLAA